MTPQDKAIEIFYAEDQKADRVLFQLALKEIPLPAHLKMVRDGKEAVDFLNNSDGYVPDIIFLDFKMPFKDGNECLQEIRKNKKFKLTPVVLFSTSCDENDIQNAYNNKANLFVQKPYDFEHQVTLMEKLFNLDWKEHPPQAGQEKFFFKL